MNNEDLSLTDKIYQELVDGLRTGLDYTHFQAKYRDNKSPFYNAFGRFQRDMEPKVRELAAVQAKLDDVGLKLDEAGLTLDSLDQQIKEAKSSLVPLEETKTALNEGIETLETKLTEKSELLEHAGKLEKLGLDSERLRQLQGALREIGVKHGLKGKEAVGKFFDDLKDYEAVLEAEALLHGLQTQIETKKLEAEKCQAAEEALSRRHNDLKEDIGAVHYLRTRNIKVGQLVIWQRILNQFETLEQFEESLARYADMTKLLNVKKEQLAACQLRLTKAQSRLETLEREMAKIEAAIDALRVAGIKQLEAMTQATEKQLKAMGAIQIREEAKTGAAIDTLRVGALKELKGVAEAADKQLKAMVATQIRQTRVVGQGVRNEIDALGEKATEVGRAVGIVEEQLRRDGKARDILNLLQNPMAATYENCAPLVLLLAISIRIWVNENKDKFSQPYRVDEGLGALVKNLGGS